MTFYSQPLFGTQKVKQFTRNIWILFYFWWIYHDFCAESFCESIRRSKYPTIQTIDVERIELPSISYCIRVRSMWSSFPGCFHVSDSLNPTMISMGIAWKRKIRAMVCQNHKHVILIKHVLPIHMRHDTRDQYSTNWNWTQRCE